MNAKILLSTYVMTMFASATLLFLVQPIVGKLLVPFLGGTPAVWNTCMVFFQAILLMGYLYAHGLSKLAPKKQLMIHLPMIVIAGLMLPIAAPTSIPPQDAPIGWLIGTLFLMIGAPFFAISTTAPLLQSWFSHTDHPTAKDPYHLYAASNLGSMTSLLGYPFLVEPFAALEMQTFGWTIGFVIFALGVALCGVVVIKASQNEAENPQKTQEVVEKPSIKEVLIWILLAFIPSSLVLGTTTYITTDVASIPLLWLVPLALYLLTFIIVFSNRITLNTDRLATLSLVCIPIAGLIEWFGSTKFDMLVVVGTFVGILFICSLTAHALLAQRRPHVKHLTAFFLWMSFGGVLGGIFNAIISPYIFDSYVEFWLILSAAALTFAMSVNRDKPMGKSPHHILNLVMTIAMSAGTVYVIQLMLVKRQSWPLVGAIIVAILVAATIIVLSYKVKLAVGITLCVGLMAVHYHRFYEDLGSSDLTLERSFFGVHRVYMNKGRMSLGHGTTFHGSQSIKKRDEPTSYYTKLSPLGQLFRALEASNQSPKHVAAIGLGAGTVATYHRMDRKIDFYEIDPIVGKLASNPEYFTYLQQCGDQCKVHIGDGRLKLQHTAKENSLDLIILDAYSSDAIPIHLSTKEAVEIYWKKLKPTGIIAFHISNRHFNLAPVIARLAQATDAVAFKNHYYPNRKKDPFATSSTWVMVGKKESNIQTILKGHSAWSIEKPNAKAPLWTDSYSNLLGALED